MTDEADPADVERAIAQLETDADSSLFVRASELRDSPRPHPPIKHTQVEYADGSKALAIYPAAEDGPHFGTTEWVSALGDSFVDLAEVR